MILLECLGMIGFFLYFWLQLQLLMAPFLGEGERFSCFRC